MLIQLVCVYLTYCTIGLATTDFITQKCRYNYIEIIILTSVLMFDLCMHASRCHGIMEHKSMIFYINPISMHVYKLALTLVHSDASWSQSYIT